jgi:hypothetical protein
MHISNHQRALELAEKIELVSAVVFMLTFVLPWIRLETGAVNGYSLLLMAVHGDFTAANVIIAYIPLVIVICSGFVLFLRFLHHEDSSLLAFTTGLIFFSTVLTSVIRRGADVFSFYSWGAGIALLASVGMSFSFLVHLLWMDEWIDGARPSKTAPIK